MNRMKTLLVIAAILASPVTLAKGTNETQKSELATQVSRCYVAHESSHSDMYKNRETDKYVVLLANLVGADNVQKVVNIADGRFKNLARNSVTPIVAKQEIKRYCTALDEKLQALSD
ncbi:hypothetical protein [Thalassotalea sp. PS06]|uniref:hypothetical protein n=1 Tax=Thalassotalea sp. PS06 TaxID=2594005 RepID=UPI0011630D79|nr:hypothetical protein [Thalassotalea sp. PS06]QDP02451.1 hypothetical protein FNC98_14505 [Thalassotalea sp. PS06]